jgi:hypothetical protein
MQVPIDLDGQHGHFAIISISKWRYTIKIIEHTKKCFRKEQPFQTKVGYELSFGWIYNMRSRQP